MEKIHLLVESGPEKGRTLTVPPEGARAGRSSSNDIVLNDESLSRFHCRFYFKDRRDLFVSDLASTNETLVNGKAVQEARLAPGDRVTIGETTMKVVSATLEGAPPPEAEAGSGIAYIESPPEPVAVPPAHAVGEIDLGLQPRPPLKVLRSEHPRRPALLLAVLGVAVLAVAGAAVWKFVLRPGAAAAGTAAVSALALEVDYEKVEASNRNIFFYRLQIRDNTLSIRIVNLEDGRQLSREKRLDPKIVEDLARQLQAMEFFQLNAEYTGLAPEIWESKDLALTIGARTHRVRVVNRIEPPAFRDARQALEEFCRNETGTFAVALPRERLMELAQEAWLQGRKLFDEREVKVGNLSAAIQRFTEVETLLEVVEPKPDIFAAAVAAREECSRLLQERYDDLNFQADRAIRLREWQTANNHLVTILDLIPDREDDRYQKAYKKLLDVQRRLRAR